MDSQVISVIIGIVILAALVFFVMWRGGQYIGDWIINGANGGRCLVKRTRQDARKDGKEFFCVYKVWEENTDGKRVLKNCTSMVQRRWITSWDKFIEDIE